MTVSSATCVDSVQSLPDLLETGLSLVFCGINPGIRAASTGHHFEGRGNRFWRVMYLAGFTPELIRPEDDHTVLRYGCGLTTVVPRATAQAAELSRSEIEVAGEVFRRKIVFLGKMALSAISRRRDIHWGLQTEPFGGARAWVVPNPSGLNRSFDLDALVAAYREVRIAVASTP
jgi:TDG/mug DNA glycosylase family protein